MSSSSAADAGLEAVARLRRGRELGAGDEQLVLEAQDVGRAGAASLASARATPSAEVASSSAP